MKSTVELVKEIKALAIERGYTFATAESCTGGLIGGAITAEPGISQCYPGGVISYANEIKQGILGVPEAVLASVGAVSEECAIDMAKGVRDRFGADFAVAVTGIAGPDGGTAQKPVGLVYIAVATKDNAAATKNVFPGDRAAVRAATVNTALQHLYEVMAIGGIIDGK